MVDAHRTHLPLSYTFTPSTYSGNGISKIWRWQSTLMSSSARGLGSLMDQAPSKELVSKIGTLEVTGLALSQTDWPLEFWTCSLLTCDKSLHSLSLSFFLYKPWIKRYLPHTLLGSNKKACKMLSIVLAHGKISINVYSFPIQDWWKCVLAVPRDSVLLENCQMIAIYPIPTIYTTRARFLQDHFTWLHT